MTEWMCGQVAAGCGAVVVSTDYHLAPEHPAPAALEDGQHALERLLAEADHRRFDRQRWAAFGDSAGGNLTALLALHHRDVCRRALAAGDHAAYAACGEMRVQGLVYPVTDLTFGFPSHQLNGETPVLTAAAMHAFRDHYLGEGSPTPDDPASALTSRRTSLTCRPHSSPLPDEIRCATGELPMPRGSPPLASP